MGDENTDVSPCDHYDVPDVVSKHKQVGTEM